MAILTLPLCSFGNGAVVVEYDINDQTWAVIRMRCINDSPFPAVGIIRQAGEVIFTAIAPAYQTMVWPVAGVHLAWQPDYWNDLTQQLEPSGIDMKDYQFGAQWPGEV